MRLQILKYCLGIFLLICNVCFAQLASKGIAEIDKAIADKRIEAADAILQTLVDSYYIASKPDSLVKYIYHVGKVAQVKTDAEQAVKKLVFLLKR